MPREKNPELDFYVSESRSTRVLCQLSYFSQKSGTTRSLNFHVFRNKSKPEMQHLNKSEICLCAGY